MPPCTVPLGAHIPFAPPTPSRRHWYVTSVAIEKQKQKLHNYLTAHSRLV